LVRGSGHAIGDRLAEYERADALMQIELRILSGARAGQMESFDAPVVTAGRDASCELRFDAAHDLDVSARHAELRAAHEGAGYVVRDSGSTNGTYVNGQRLAAGAAHVLRTGDIIGFGAHGPTVVVRITATGEVPKTALSRPSTTRRIAVAVRQQTRRLRVALGAAIVLIVATALAGVLSNRREGAQVERLSAAYASATKQLASRLSATNDSALIRDLQRRNDSLIQSARAARGAHDVSAARAALTQGEDVTRALTEMNLPALRAANDAAVALIVSVIAGQQYEATGFSIASSGLIVTNRHVVRDSSSGATNVMIKFADTGTWRRAHVVRVADGAADDLALLQIDEGGAYPAVRGIADSLDVPVGSPIATLGFPMGTDAPMDRRDGVATASTTLMTGTISKSVADVLQIDSFASHGSSGSPVFDEHGHVIGVVWGGPAGAQGRIVYAVPANRIARLVEKQ
jgi:S1-C subfamily serine protease